MSFNLYLQHMDNRHSVPGIPVSQLKQTDIVEGVLSGLLVVKAPYNQALNMVIVPLLLHNILTRLTVYPDALECAKAVSVEEMDKARLDNRLISITGKAGKSAPAHFRYQHNDPLVPYKVNHNFQVNMTDGRAFSGKVGDGLYINRRTCGQFLLPPNPIFYYEAPRDWNGKVY